MINYTGHFKVIQDIVNWINNYQPEPSEGMPMPPDWDQASAYQPDQYVTKDEKIYKAITTVSAGSAWDSTKWTEITDQFNEFFQSKPGKLNISTHAEVFNNTIANTATGVYSHAEGISTKASGPMTHSEGYFTTASGAFSHSEGQNAVASGTGSHAEGYMSNAKGDYSHAECKGNAYGSYSHAEGSSSQTGRSDLSQYSFGAYSHAEGESTFAYGMYSHTEGQGSQAGSDTTTIYGAHAEGRSTKAYASGSHSEGYFTEANGQNSHVGGSYGSTASTAENAFSHGLYTTANNQNEAAFGKYNSSSSDTAFSVGNGTDENSRSNLFELKTDGSGYLNGNPIVAIPAPTTDGTYTLKCTVADGVPTYSWVADT